jgi:glycosyltransferase involved in cell wall biosynthesis/GT2 family glycosyltransferase
VRILLSYSSQLFDPRLPLEQQSYRGASANIISRTLYEILGRHGDVTFVDAASPEEVEGQRFDLLVGIVRNFSMIHELCEIDRSILVAVNMHPAEHNRLLLDFVVSEGLPTGALHPLDLQDAEGRIRDIDAADLILLFGNVRTLNSYLHQGVPAEKIRLINLGSDLGTQPPSAEARGRREGTQFLYCASEIGLRKGFDVLESAMGEADLGRLGAHLHVVGAASFPHYRQRLEQLEDQFGPHVTDHGWLPASSGDYRELLESVDYLFFPSLEEGQAGTVLDAMACGVIPLISRNCGVDFAPLGFCELETSAGRNAELLRRACELRVEERDRLRGKTLEYYEEFHGDFEARLEEAVADLLAGEARPRVSVVLPVHDKESVLAELLRFLDGALVAYGAVDLTLIFDGCSDRSEEIARGYFAGRDDYPVRIITTPDIFEVRTNNLGLKDATGRYAMVLQDDNFIRDRDCILEAVIFMQKSRRAAIVGGLAGVNFYPRGTRDLSGPGQIVADENEVYWRQDADTDAGLRDRIFQVDACMRGPLFFSKEFLERHGYLDEAYAPLYADDMDISFRAASVGWKVYCILMDVENDSLTMRTFDPEKAKWWSQVVRRNMGLFYSRWQPSTEKDYLWVHRTPLAADGVGLGEGIFRARHRVRRRYLTARRRMSTLRAREALGGLRARLRG